MGGGGGDTFLNQQINVLEAKKTEVAVKHRGTGCSTGYGKSAIYVVLASSAKLVHVQMHGPSHVYVLATHSNCLSSVHVLEQKLRPEIIT